MKKTLITIATTLSAILIVTTATYALGTLTPSGNPGNATQYTLNDIYTKLTAGTATSTKTGSISVPGNVSASFRTLTEIYNSIPATLSITSSTTTVPVGINRATTTLDAIDGDLTAANIVTGKTIFGVEGTASAGAPSLTWQTNPGLALCWSAGQFEADNGCSIGSGWTAEGYGAVEYCQNLDTEGPTYWRLPTIAEYQSITDFSAINNATQVSGFAQSTYYWSSTPVAEIADLAWDWDSNLGDISYNHKINSYAVRCVH